MDAPTFHQHRLRPLHLYVAVAALFAILGVGTVVALIVTRDDGTHPVIVRTTPIDRMDKADR